MIPNEVFAETLLEFLAPVRQYLDDPSVTEVMINGPEQVYVERRGRLERTGARFSSRESVMCALRNAAQFVGKHVDEQHPILEARLPDGSRVQAVVPPVASDGPYVAIRRFSQDTFTTARLIELGALTPLAAEVLRVFVQAKLNVIIAGGTGSGKTSLLNMLTNYIPETDRIAVIEDSKEVQVQTTARRVHGIAAARSGRPRRGHDPRPISRVATHASGSDHHRRDPRRAKRSTSFKRWSAGTAAAWAPCMPLIRATRSRGSRRWR